METITTLLHSIDFDWNTFLQAAAILAVGSILLGAVGRFAFGKRSTLNHAVSSAIGIIFIYAATVVLRSMETEYQAFLVPLPFVSFNGGHMFLFSFSGADYTVICTQILSMIILAFLANLFDTVLPRGKHLIGWLLLRCLSIVLAMVAHWGVNWLFTTYLPMGLVTYAPTILLALMILLLLVGALKLVVGAVLATVHPLIGAFYTFFFATLVGKALTKAVITTGILCAVVWGLNYIGCSAISIASAALIAYIPLLIVLLIVWYIVSRVL